MLSNRQIRAFVATVMMISAAYSQPVDFESQVRPILEENCFDCHGPDKQKAGLRLDQRVVMLKGGDSGLASLVPGDLENSYLIEVINGSDPDMQMPPKGDPLTEDQVAIIKQWVAEGGNWPGQMDDKVAGITTDHWSYQEVERPELSSKTLNPVDSFLNKKLEEKGLQPNPPADPHSLIRRASITITGLPPSVERVEKFISNYAKDPGAAYESLVDELLASDHYGERWAQHWLDVIRWAETNGSEANLYRKNAWIYRDYVIRSFNEDLPYDQFITEQLAGDQLGVGEATGFLVAGPHVPAATVGREPTAIRQARADRMDEIMQTIGASMLGVTVSCARCHNHKFDPISIQDYYSLTAVFQGVEFGGRYPEFGKEHPRQIRAKELRQEMFKRRRMLKENEGQWLEDWGGFHELSFPAITTKALRIEFKQPGITIDEFDVYGTEQYTRNLALSSNGAKLKTDDSMTKKGSGVWKANDGQYGTMAWRSNAPKGGKEKPWVEIHLEEKQEVNRFRVSGNREYYFETDYLSVEEREIPGCKVLALQSDGSWLEVGDTKKIEKILSKDAERKRVSDELHGLIQQLGEEGPQHSFIGKFIDPVKTFVLQRGSPENPRGEVAPAGFEVLGGDLGLDSSTPNAERRMEFAKWLTQADHPLTARVMVNRIWHHIFGQGIVPTTSDFGVAGAKPSHPKLLDWLADEYAHPQRKGVKPWSTKEMIKLIVMSEAFQRDSKPSEEELRIDAGSMFLWRFPPRRMEAEVIRDSILIASGAIDRSLGGRSFRIHNEKATYAQWEVVNNYGDETWRRMIYQERMRRVDDQIFTAFDFPDCGQVRAKRPVSTTPLQALNLMNSPFVMKQSKLIAERAVKEAGEDKAAQVKKVFEYLLTRAPSPEELSLCLETELTLVCRSLINSNEFSFLP